MLTRAATEAALPSLLGMALDYAPSMDAHDARRKVGIITEANIVPIPQRGSPDRKPASPSLSSPTSIGDKTGPNSPTCTGALALSRAGAPPLSPVVGDRVGPSPIGQVAISGYLFAHDFPDVVNEIRAQKANSLGMSYEIANATVPNQDAMIWAVTGFTFTGAAVLRRDKAAYPQTWIALEPQASSHKP